MTLMGGSGLHADIAAAVANFTFVTIGATVANNATIVLGAAAAGKTWLLIALFLLPRTPATGLVVIRSGTTAIGGTAAVPLPFNATVGLVIPPASVPWAAGVAGSDLNILNVNGAPADLSGFAVLKQV